MLQCLKMIQQCQQRGVTEIEVLTAKNKYEYECNAGRNNLIFCRPSVIYTLATVDFAIV